MQHHRIFFPDMRLDSVDDGVPEFRERFERDGIVVLPGFLRNDPLFNDFLGDLRRLATRLSEMAGVPDDGTADLSDQLTAIARENCKLVGKIYDLGTRPNKLLSGMLLKLHPAFLEMTRAVFGVSGTPVIATPTLSDTLHVFPPGADSYRFNLPIHQDYPYLLQSPNQVTFWVSLSRKQKDVGGMTAWAGSHKLGICAQRRDANRHLECVTDGIDLGRYEEIRVDADLGDVVVFHSNILHRSEKNYSSGGTRIVQLFRFSDLNDPEALRIGWDSADVTQTARKFEDVYPEKVMG